MVTRARRGKTSPGCLLALLIVAGIGYYAFTIGRVYLRHFRYQDAMVQEARFAAGRPDELIIRRLRAQVDSLGLPDGARRVHVRRTNGMIFIWSDYVQTVYLPGFTRDIDFTAHAERPL